MKLFRKILPLSALAIVGTIPVVATSCSNVYVDLLSKQYVPSDVTPLASQELASSEAEAQYYNYFKNKKGSLASDSLWGSSFYANTMFSTDNPLSKFETFLSHIYSFDIQEDTTGTHRLSYTLKTQAQVRDNTELSGKGSYSVNTYDIYFELHNIECYATYTNKYIDKDGKTFQIWTLLPNKYNIARGRWYQELKGNESIKFEIKAVYKGYSETGAQNYIKEINESAIIDEAHKYVPELNDIYTELMLLTPYFLSNVEPRMFITENGYPNTIEQISSEYTSTFNFDFGSQTKTDEADEAIELTPLPYTYVYSPTDSGATVASIAPDTDMKVSSLARDASVKFTFNGTPRTGDIVYYCIQAKHPAVTATSQPEWFEWFTVSSILS